MSEQKEKQGQMELKEQNQEQNPAVAKAAPAVPKKLIDAGIMGCFTAPKKAFIAAGGTEEQFSKEANFAMQALMQNDFLISCAKSHPDNLIESIKNVALTGLTLNPVLKLGYLVPFKGKISFMSSYMGKCEILMRSGMVKNIYAELVYENDKFELKKGTNGFLNHEPELWGDRGEIKGGYYFAQLQNGSFMFDVMRKDRILEIRDRSESFKKGKASPWLTDEAEMMRKTIINWAFKFLPKTGVSQDVLNALEIESAQQEEDIKEWKESQKKDDFGEEFQNAEVVE